MIKNAFAIPQELRDLKQWILWRYEDKGGKKPTKVPYTITHNLASVTNPNDWSTFNEAFNVFQFGNYDGVGFVFCDADPYTFIDLDDCSTLANGDPNPNYQADMERQLKIYKEFNSYSEVSPSGKGLHIIVKGKLPQGRRRSFIELYSNQRYATMTGNVYNDVAIADRNQILNELFKQMGGGSNVTYHTGDAPQTLEDAKIIEQASEASNGDKFQKLYNGEWNDFYSSQSEADFALIDIVAFYTQNREQIARLFRASALGKRKKADRKDYVEWMINKSFDRIPPNIDFDGFRIALEEKIAERNAIDNAKSAVDNDNTAASGNGSPSAFDADSLGSNPSAATNDGPVAQRSELVAHNGLVAGSNPAGTTILPPPGLMGEIAQFIYTAAPRPVPEIALAAAIGLMAGVCGRAYNVSGTGLNQYVLLLANTGTGKEAMASGIDKIVNAVSMQVPVASEFIGPSEIASGQALVKFLANKSQSFVSVLGEFGIRLQAMSDPRANGAEKTLKRMMLDLYNKSGHGQVARPSIYADSEKNTNLITSPSFSILAESTPETFYSALTEEMIADGLLPRFMLVEYNGPRPKLNESHMYAQPPMMLIDKVASLMANAKTVMANRRVTDVNINDDAQKLLNKFNELADSKINTTDKEVVRQLWNRAHIKALKISALIAVGVNPFNPMVLPEYVVWAKDLITHDIKSLSAKFERGEIGRNTDEIKQVSDMKKAIGVYIKGDWDKVKSYVSDQRMHSQKVIPHSYLNKRLSAMASYKNDNRAKASILINNVVKIMIDGGSLIEVSKKQLMDKFGTTMRAFVVSDVKEFL